MSDRENDTGQLLRDRGAQRRLPDTVFAGAAAAALAVAGALYLVEQTTPTVIHRGAYSILVGLFVFAGCGYLARSEGSRTRREVRRRSGSTADTEQLRGLLREAFLTGAMWQRMAQQAGDLTAQPAGLDEESIRAARRISMRLLREDDGRS